MSNEVKVPTRADIDKRYTWDLESVYAENSLWEEEFAAVASRLGELEAFKGKLSESAATLLQALTLRDQINEQVLKLAQYSSSRADEDNNNSLYVAMRDRGNTLWARAAEAASFIAPEVLAMPEGQIAQFTTAEPGLRLYGHFFDDLLRSKEHILTPRDEALLAAAADMANMPGEIHSMLINADLKFGAVPDENGQQVELTSGRYLRLRQSNNREVRKAAFFRRWEIYKQFSQTLATTFSANAKKTAFYARARNYPSGLAMELDGDNIPTAVYTTLIDTVHKELPRLQDYLKMRQRVLELDDMRMYDIYMPLVNSSVRDIPYDEGVAMVLAALAPLGEEYVSIAREGLNNRWVDVFETAGKTSGAYSSGSYKSKPFILLNYQNTLNDVYTLAHELGHSMHTYFTHRTQPFLYSHYTLFVAEVASTFNEALLSHYLLHNSNDPAVRAAVLNENLEGVRSTLYRQAQAAEFELLAHQQSEAGEGLTADSLNQIWLDLNRQFYAPAVNVDEEIAVEWGAFPHFYSDFYVYKYATGISASTALARAVVEQGQPAVDRYLNFLSRGGSEYSINLLRDAGVDMTTPQPVVATLEQFSENLTQMEDMLRGVGAGA